MEISNSNEYRDWLWDEVKKDQPCFAARTIIDAFIVAHGLSLREIWVSIPAEWRRWFAQGREAVALYLNEVTAHMKPREDVLIRMFREYGDENLDIKFALLYSITDYEFLCDTAINDAHVEIASAAAYGLIRMREWGMVAKCAQRSCHRYVATCSFSNLKHHNLHDFIKDVANNANDYSIRMDARRHLNLKGMRVGD